MYRLAIRATVAIALLAVLFVGSSIVRVKTGDQSPTLDLQRPLFLQSVQAAEGDNSQIGTFLDSEAGISAYFQVDGPINLATVRSLYQTIEVENADYIIGSIPVPNYTAETEHAHVYIHKNGWVLAYYSKAEPTSKMLDLTIYESNRTITTKLRNVAATVAQAAGSSFSDVTYYHFQYPNATKILVVAEINDGNGNDFKITLPSSFGYYERSWALRGGYHAGFALDSKTIGFCEWGCAGSYGIITADQLLPDVSHVVAVSNYGALVLVYRVP